MDLAKILDQLNTQGVALVESFLHTDETCTLYNEALAILDNSRPEQNMPVYGEEKLQTEQISQIVYPGLSTTFNSTPLSEIARNYSKKDAQLSDIVIAKNRDSLPLTEIHFDLKRALKFMIYLTDTNRDNGAFRYCLQSHRKNMLFRRDYLRKGGNLHSLPNIAAKDEVIEMTDMEGPRGTLVIFDTDGFHSAGQISPGLERFIIRGRTLLGGWHQNRLLMRLNRLNPARLICIPPTIPGRKSSQGRTLSSQRKRQIESHEGQ